MCIMYNFNHERWFIAVYILGVCRSIIDECFKWGMQRRAFDQRLMDQGIVQPSLSNLDPRPPPSDPRHPPLTLDSS